MPYRNWNFHSFIFRDEEDNSLSEDNHDQQVQLPSQKVN